LTALVLMFYAEYALGLYTYMPIPHNTVAISYVCVVNNSDPETASCFLHIRELLGYLLVFKK